MDTATQTAVPKTYIAEWIKLDFFNNSNLKHEIQSRISNNIEQIFINALNEMRGDNKDSYGISFSEITLLAMAYFYSELFMDKIKSEYYTLEMVKGFLDANNRTPYTAIHEIDVQFYKLNDKPLFRHCWLIIQSAWFFNSQYFGHHQHIDYVNHYINTGQQLPMEHYNFDRNYLIKKYEEITNSKAKNITVNGFTHVCQWYFSILFLICKELSLPTKHFSISNKDNRQYNPLTKTSRQLRPLTPFKIIECDIKSAFPTFLDIETGASLKDHVYNNLMRSKSITRGEAKILFNKVCNSGKYKTILQTKDFFLSCGYTEKECESLITLTHDSKRKFISFMTEYEALAITYFVNSNDLKRGARLHDALLFIDDKTKPEILQVHPNCDFGYKELNRPIVRESFKVGSKFLNYAYINSIPKGLELTSKHDFIKPAVKGEANGFKFYIHKFEYYNAGFNLNDFKADYSTFIENCNTMFDCLVFLNRKPLKRTQLYLIIKHIRENSNYVFNVRALYSKFTKYQTKAFVNPPKKRDFDFTENLNFKKKIDFLNAMNQAKGIINSKNNYNELFDLLQERIENNDYSYLNEYNFIGRKKNNLLSISIIRMFNLLCTGQMRMKRELVKSYPLYTTIIKSVTLKTLSLKYQQQNAFLKQQITKYERELKQLNRLVNNREEAKQLFLILCDVRGADGKPNEPDIIKMGDVQKRLKAELITMIDKKAFKTLEAGEKEFNKRFISNSIKVNQIIKDLENVFDTHLKNSVFNQIGIQEANERGEIFFKEYLNFHKVDEVKEPIIIAHKEKYKLPEIDFN